MLHEVKVYAVIGGTNYEGEDFASLKLFDCLSTAQAYVETLTHQEGYDYTLMEIKTVNMESSILV